MCVKLPHRDLKSEPLAIPPHPTSTYAYKVTIALRMCNGTNRNFEMSLTINEFYFLFFPFYIWWKVINLKDAIYKHYMWKFWQNI